MTQKPSPVSELQIKVSQLENKLEEKDQEIGDLKTELSDLNNQMENVQASQTNAAAEDVKAVKSSDKDKSASSGENILRVAISVEELQHALKNAGYYDGPIDGKIGQKTKKSIEQFQKDHNLKSDGVVGKKTWSELKTYLKEN